LLDPPIKRQLADWARLSQKKFRSSSGLFLIEGDVCVREALKSSIALEAVLVLASEEARWLPLVGNKLRAPLFRVTTDAFRRITSVETSQGIAAVARQFDLKLRPTGFAVACEQVSDPGNCGALVRVADFFGASELLLGPGSADRFNEKVVRGSMGSLFRQPVRNIENFEDTIRTWPGDTIAAVAHGGTPIKNALKTSPPTLLVLGNETRGLSSEVERLCAHKLTLQPAGGAESLNLVAAAAVFCYELGYKRT
jgi:TrmH family RNA methyltransferase